MDAQDGHGPQRRGRTLRRHKTPYSRPDTSNSRSSQSLRLESDSGGRGDGLSFVRRGVAWMTTPFLGLAPKWPGAGLAAGKEQAADELEAAQPPQTGVDAKDASEVSGERPKIEAAAPETSGAQAAAPPERGAETPLQQNGPTGVDVGALHLGSELRGTGGPVGSRTLGFHHLMTNSPDVARVQSAGFHRSRTSLLSAPGSALPGAVAKRLPFSPGHAESESEGLDAATEAGPSTSQPRPWSSGMAHKPLTLASAPTFSLRRQPSAERQPFSGKPSRAALAARTGGSFLQPKPIFAQGAGSLIPSKPFGNQGDAGRKATGQIHEPIQYGQLPQSRPAAGAGKSLLFLEKRARIGQKGLSSAAHIQRRTIVPARQAVGASASFLGQAANQIGGVGPGLQPTGISSRTSSIGTKEMPALAAAAADLGMASEEPPAPGNSWTPLRTFTGVQERTKLSGLKRGREGTPASQRRLRQKAEAVRPLGSVERLNWKAGATPFNAGGGSRRRTPDSVDSRDDAAGSPVGGREMTDTARRILSAMDAVATPSGSKSATMQLSKLPPPNSSLAGSDLQLPPSVILPLSASMNFDFQAKGSTPAKRGFLEAERGAGTSKPAFLDTGHPGSFPPPSEQKQDKSAKPWSSLHVPEASGSKGLPSFGKPGLESSSRGEAVSFSPWNAPEASKLPEDVNKPAAPTEPERSSQAAAKEPDYTFGESQSQDQREEMNKLEQAVKSASKTAAEPAVSYTFGEQSENGDAKAVEPAEKAPLPWFVDPRTEKDTNVPAKPALPTLGRPKPGAYGLFGPAVVPTGKEAEQKNEESVKAARVQLPSGSDSDDDDDEAAVAEEPAPVSKPPAAGGWDLAFLQKNQAAGKKALDAVEKELAAGEVSEAPEAPAQTFTFGVSHKTPQASLDSVKPSENGDAATPSIFSFGKPSKEAEKPDEAGGSELLPNFLAPAVGEKPKLSTAAKAFDIKFGAPDKAAGKENNLDTSAVTSTSALGVLDFSAAGGSGLPLARGESPLSWGATPKFGAQPSVGAQEAGGGKDAAAKIDTPQAFQLTSRTEAAEGKKEVQDKPAQIATPREPSNGSERAMSISPSVGAGVPATEFNDGTTAQSASTQVADAAPQFGVAPSASASSLFGNASMPAFQIGQVPKFSFATTASVPAFGASSSTPAFGAQSAASSMGIQPVQAGGGLFGGQATGPSFGNHQTAVSFGGQQTVPAFGSQPGNFGTQSVPNFMGGSLPSANGQLGFGSMTAAAPPQSAPGFSFGASVPSFAATAPQPAMGGIAFGVQAPGQTQGGSGGPFGGFSMQNGSAPFGQAQPGAVFGSQNFAFGSTGGQQQQPGGMTLGQQTADPNVLAARKKVKAKRAGKK